MEQRGFDYPAQINKSTPPLATDIGNRDWVASYGFGISTLPPPSAASSDPLADYVLSLPDASRRAFSEALGAEDTEGCLRQGDREAREELGIADVDERFSLMPSPLEDPRMQEAEAEWRECVSAVGVASNDLLELIGSFSTRLTESASAPAALSALQKDEITTAVATFDCNAARNEVLATVTRDLLVSQS